MFEYSQKGLSHAINHTSELVQCGGHHGAYNTATNEVSHKTTIKKASRFSETRATRNDTHEGMLKYVLYRVLWQAAIDLNKRLNPQTARSIRTADKVGPRYRLLKRLPYTSKWSSMVFHRGRPPRLWRNTFLSKHMLVTREELISWVLDKLGLEKTLQNLVMVVSELKWDCYGAVSLQNNGDGTTRKVVGLGSHGRRDFVRLMGSSTDIGTGTAGPATALSVQVDKSACVMNKSANCFYQSNFILFSQQVQMFIHISNFGHGSGIFLPPNMQDPELKNPKNTSSVVLAVVRWMSPHPNAMLCDSEHLPVCVPPFDLNHALWTFTKLDGPRDSFSDANVRRQLDLFPGSDLRSKLHSASTFKRARYDLIELDSIDKFINCTTINEGTDDTILETITLPFDV